MQLTRTHFAAFFAAANSGNEPFPWQEDLLDHLLENGRWPDRIVAPTGSGKTSVIDVHIFAVALAYELGGPRLPRRLAMVVDRRVLVDDQYARAQTLSRLLVESDLDVVTAVRHVLRRLRWRGRPIEIDTPAAEIGSPLVLGQLRGGQLPSRFWMDEPTAAMVLSATPDMFGSRLLFRSYGAAPASRPRAAGL
ncbi:MAG: hypothetical protein ACK5JT_08380, partial [Hyphomicrobiaceae bacterium]